MKKHRINRCPYCDDPSCKLTWKDFLGPQQNAKKTKKANSPKQLKNYSK